MMLATVLITAFVLSCLALLGLAILAKAHAYETSAHAEREADHD